MFVIESSVLKSCSAAYFARMDEKDKTKAMKQFERYMDFVKRIEDEKFESLKTFVDSFKDLSEFAKYINEIVKIINNRTEKIEQYLKSKTINSDYNNN